MQKITDPDEALVGGGGEHGPYGLITTLPDLLRIQLRHITRESALTRSLLPSPIGVGANQRAAVSDRRCLALPTK